MATDSARNVRKKAGIRNSANLVTGVTWSIAAGSTNIANVTFNFKTGPSDGQVLAAPRVFDIYLSDSAAGTGLTATTASGTVQAASGAGAVFGTYTAKKALRVQALATGLFTLEITDSAKTGFYVVVVDPFTGHNYVSPQLITANYG